MLHQMDFLLHTNNTSEFLHLQRFPWVQFRLLVRKRWSFIAWIFCIKMLLEKQHILILAIPLHVVCFLWLKLLETLILKTLHETKSPKYSQNKQKNSELLLMFISWRVGTVTKIPSKLLSVTVFTKNIIRWERWLGINIFCLLSQII